MQQQLIPISKLKTNTGQIEGLPKNPRFIKDERFKAQVQSVLTFPKMLSKRKIVLSSESEPISIGGNMRLKSVEHILNLKESDFRELCEQYNVIDENIKIWEANREKKAIPNNWVDYCDDWTIDEKREFIIKDNIGFGEHDWDELANSWDSEDLVDWGMEIPGWAVPEDYSDKNKEIDADDFEDKMTIKLEYTADDYEMVKTALHKVAATPEQAVWQLLNLDNE